MLSLYRKPNRRGLVAGAEFGGREGQGGMVQGPVLPCEGIPAEAARDISFRQAFPVWLFLRDKY